MCDSTLGTPIIIGVRIKKFQTNKWWTKVRGSINSISKAEADVIRERRRRKMLYNLSQSVSSPSPQLCRTIMGWIKASGRCLKREAVLIHRGVICFFIHHHHHSFIHCYLSPPSAKGELRSRIFSSIKYFLACPGHSVYQTSCEKRETRNVPDLRKVSERGP